MKSGRPSQRSRAWTASWPASLSSGATRGERVTVGHLDPKSHPPNRRTKVAVILEHLADLADDLTTGVIAMITDERIRIRRLPLLHDECSLPIVLADA